MSRHFLSLAVLVLVSLTFYHVTAKKHHAQNLNSPSGGHNDREHKDNGDRDHAGHHGDHGGDNGDHGGDRKKRDSEGHGDNDNDNNRDKRDHHSKHGDNDNDNNRDKRDHNSKHGDNGESDRQGRDKREAKVGKDDPDFHMVELHHKNRASTNPLPFHISNFTLTPCDPAAKPAITINYANISQDFKLSASVTVNEDICKPDQAIAGYSNISTRMKLLGFERSIPIPCPFPGSENGQCKSPNICALKLPEFVQEMLKKAGLPTGFPLKKGEYKVENQLIVPPFLAGKVKSVRVPVWLMKGKLQAMFKLATDKPASLVLGCHNVEFSVVN